MKTLLECLQLAADALKDGRVVKFRHKANPTETITMHETGRIKSSENQQIIQESFTDPVWEIIEEPDYEGFAKAVLATPCSSQGVTVQDLAKRFNIPMEDK